MTEKKRKLIYNHIFDQDGAPTTSLLSFPNQGSKLQLQQNIQATSHVDIARSLPPLVPSNPMISRMVSSWPWPLTPQAFGLQNREQERNLM